MPPSLPGRAQKAARHQGYRFRPLDGRLDEACLTPCWRAMRKEAAAGVEQRSAQAYEQHLDETLHHLVERLTQHRSRATRVRRHDSPKGAGTQRPLGSPAVAATLRPLAVARL